MWVAPFARAKALVTNSSAPISLGRNLSKRPAHTSLRDRKSPSSTLYSRHGFEYESLKARPNGPPAPERLMAFHQP